MKSIFVCLLLVLACTNAVGSQDGADWLMKINNAARELDYTGTFVYVQGQRVESMRVTHQAKGGTMRQRIYSLNGAPREVIRDSKQVWCYLPDKHLGVHEFRQVTKQGFPNLLPRGLEHLSKYYEVDQGAAGRIADRTAQQIKVVPKDEFRYGYDLWADRDSGLLLRATLLNDHGEPIEQYLFTEVHIGEPIAPEDLEPVTSKSDLVWYGDAQNRTQSQSGGGEMSDGKWIVDDAPAGFMLTRKIRRMSPLRSKMIEHYVYSDGLATVSVFVEKIGDDSGPRIKGLNRMGAVHAFGREIEGHQITVVGEVPPQTVDKIGMSVHKMKQ